MFNLTKEQKELITANGLEDVYIGRIVQILKSEKYTYGDEIAIIRKKDIKPDEFKEYNDFIEECIEKAKALWNAEEVE